MGRVPLLFLVSVCTALSACTPEAEPPATQEQRDAIPVERDAGQAARDAIKSAGEALRRLSGRSDDTSLTPDVPAVDPSSEKEMPAEGVTPVPATDPAPDTTPRIDGSASVIEPIPDETQQLEEEQHIQVERDASTATQEAKERILEATRRAADRFRQAGAGMVDAFRHDDLESGTADGTMSDAPAKVEPSPATPTPKTAAEAPKPE